MGNLKSFLKGNYKELGNADVKLDRFDEPVILRPLFEESEKIQENCFHNKPGKKGKQERVFNTVKYNRDICVASIVQPDLLSTELQTDLGVMGADNAYLKLFSLGERTQILEKVTELNGLDVSGDDEVEEAKN